MSVLVTDTRIIITEADDLTNWTNATQADVDFFCESPNAVQSSLVIDENSQMYYTDATSRDVSGSLIYVYSFNNALQTSWLSGGSGPPNALLLGDETNQVSFRMAGSDRRVFNHLDGPTEWQCFVLDGSEIAAMESAGLTVTTAGSYASFLTNIAALTEFGSDLTAQSKALGGGFNVGVDIIRFGKDGLRISSGSSGDPGTFFEIVLEDRSIDSLKAHGIIREYTSGVYGLQGPLTFGTASADGSWFQDSNVSVIFEDRNIGDDKLYLKVTGSSISDTTFILSDSSISTAGPKVRCDFSSSGDIRRLEITSVVFSSLGNQIDFGNDISSSFHIITANTFAGCGIIDPGNVNFDDNTISDSTNPSGSLLMVSGGAANMSGIEFNAGGVNGHAIYIPDGAVATHSFNNFTYNDFGIDNSTTASLYNNSGGGVLINVIGGSSPTVRNGSGSSTVIDNPKVLTLSGMAVNTEVTITSGSDETVIFHLENVGGDGLASYPYNFAPDTIVDVLIFHIDFDPNLSSFFNYTLLNESTTIPIQQIPDNIYSNP